MFLFQHFDRAARIALLAIVALAVLVFALTPVVYDTDHFGDTLFMASAAGRIWLGAPPVFASGLCYVFGVTMASASDGAPVLLALRHGGILGFAATRKNNAEEAEIVLNAIHPAHQGGGLYARLIERTAFMLAARGATRMIVPTQINNYAVQRVWARAGMVHERSVYTFHKWFG